MVGQQMPKEFQRLMLSGALLPFGGYKGANVALMVELLSAGLSGAAWSLDTGDFRCGSDPTKAGLTVIAFSTGFLEHSFAQRTRDQIVRLSQLGVHIPGRREEQSNGDNWPPLRIRASVLAAIEAIAGAQKS